jgi:hypothetical protein
MEAWWELEGTTFDSADGLFRHKKIHWLVDYSFILPTLGVLPMYLIIRSPIKKKFLRISIQYK